jgi:hypothetical protein
MKTKGHSVIDLQDIQTKVNEALTAGLERARSGHFGNVRGARSRFLLQEEVNWIALDTVKTAYAFTVNDLPAYVANFPDLLTTEIEGGSVGERLAEALSRHIAHNAAETARDAVLQSNMPLTPQDILADIEATIELVSDLGPHASANILARSVQRATDEPSVEHYRIVVEDALVKADEIRKLVYKLDIADPPRASLSGKIYRHLTEAADQIDFIIRTAPETAFEQTASAPSI